MMLDILFGWRKASRCKELIRCVRCRLKLLRNKRDAIIKHLRSDIAQLLDTGQQQSALFRVEQLFKDQSILVAYDLLDHFCEFIIINLPYIRRHRCADLPELQTLRKLFGERYGNDFAVGAVELFPGNLVNRQITEKLCTRSISDDVKLGIIEEIAIEYNIQLWHPEMGHGCDLPHQKVHVNEGSVYNNPDCVQGKEVLEKDIQVVYSDIRRTDMQASNHKEIFHSFQKKHGRKIGLLQGEARSHDSSSNCKEGEAHFQYHSSFENNSSSVYAAIVKNHAPNVALTIHKKAQDMEKLKKSGPGSVGESDQGTHSPSSPSTASLQHKVERTAGTVMESSTQLLESIIVYLDDLDDFHRKRQEGNECKDGKCLERDTHPKPHESKCASTRKPFQSRIELENFVSYGEGKDANSYGNCSQKSLRANREILSDVVDYDQSKKHTKLSGLHDKSSTMGHSSKKRKSVGRRPKNRSLSGQSQRYNNCVYSDHELDDFLGTNKSLFPDIPNQQHDSSMPVALSINDKECALYYDEECGCSDISSLGFQWDKTKPSGVLLSHGYHCHSVSNSDNRMFMSGEITHADGRMVNKKKHQWQISSEGSRTYSFRGHHGKKPQSFQRSYSYAQEIKAEKVENNHTSRRCKYNRRLDGNNRDMVTDCSLEHPCYFLASDEKDDWGSPSKGSGVALQAGKHPCDFQQEKEENNHGAAISCDEASSSLAINKGNSKQELIGVAVDRIQGADLDFDMELHTDIQVSTDCQGCSNTACSVIIASESHRSKMQIKEAQGPSDHHGRRASSCSSYSREIPVPIARPAYLKAMTMPPERPKITATHQTLRSASFQSQQYNRLSGHVHPKLPDYDDLAAKFTALKKVHLQTSILQVGNA
ncbi:uncharacterized protein LOC131221971 isoform X2 [Magnolia sinica]|uniref:uncharacterized protein LOC131221971 isoform X2 n=1 Tax=Magnolia sinica TaxID=86752 RepID=UPI0026584521|nr:uncharacterized protein LOC131221971 isoform X2 [Magnolia sinica]